MALSVTACTSYSQLHHGREQMITINNQSKNRGQLSYITFHCEIFSQRIIFGDLVSGYIGALPLSNICPWCGINPEYGASYVER